MRLSLARPFLCFAMLFGGLTSRASAEATVVVEAFEGRGAGWVRSAVLRGLERTPEVEIVGLADAEREAARLEVSLGEPEAYVETARRLQITAYVTGSVERTRNRWEATLRVRDAATGQVVEERRFRARRSARLRRVLERGIWNRLGRAIASAEAPPVYSDDIRELDNEVPPPETASVETLDETPPPQREAPDLDPELFGDRANEAREPVTANSAAYRDTGTRTTHALEVATQLRFFHREMHYLADTSGLSRSYTLPIGPQLALSASWFPAHPFRDDAFAHIGVTADVAHSFALASEGPDGTDYRTADALWRAGVIGRLPLGRHSLAASAGYGAHSFDVSRANLADPLPVVPPVQYRGFQFGAEGRLRFEHLSLRARGAYAVVIGTGKINTAAFFPGTTARGFEVLIEGGYPLPHGLEVVAAVDARLYKLDFDLPSGTLGPGGASDRYVGFSLGLAWRPSV